MIYGQYFIIEALGYLIMITEFGYFSIYASASLFGFVRKIETCFMHAIFWKEKLKYF